MLPGIDSLVCPGAAELDGELGGAGTREGCPAAVFVPDGAVGAPPAVNGGGASATLLEEDPIASFRE
jgi:hypothetical protein